MDWLSHKAYWPAAAAPRPARILCAPPPPPPPSPRPAPAPALSLANKAILKNQMKAEILFPEHSSTPGMGVGGGTAKNSPRIGSLVTDGGKQPRRAGVGCQCESVRQCRHRLSSGLGRPALPRVERCRSPSGHGLCCQPVCEGPALQLRGAGVPAYVCMCVCACVCERAPARADYFPASASPFAPCCSPSPPLLSNLPPPLPAAGASSPSSGSHAEFAQQPGGKKGLRTGAAETRGGMGRGEEGFR